MSFFEFITSTVMMAKGTGALLLNKSRVSPGDDNFEEISIGNHARVNNPPAVKPQPKFRHSVVVAEPPATRPRHGAAVIVTPRQTKLATTTPKQPTTSPRRISKAESAAAAYDAKMAAAPAPWPLIPEDRLPTPEQSTSTSPGTTAINKDTRGSRSGLVRSISDSHPSAPGASAPSLGSHVPVVQRTPSSMTPLARLKLRKFQIAELINKPTDDEFIGDEEAEEDTIDMLVNVHNVPLSQPLLLISHGEKFTFGNTSRAELLSLTLLRLLLLMLELKPSPETTANSILTISPAEDGLKLPYSHPGLLLLYGNVDLSNLGISRDAQQLTLEFNKSEFNQIHEESRQRRSMLANCKRFSTMPRPPALGVCEKGTMLLEETSMAELPPMPTTPCPNPRALIYGVMAATQDSAPSTPVMHAPPPVSATPPSLAEVKQLSNELSKYFTYTRPTWLPPKLDKDRLKHQKELEHIIYQALLKESQDQARKVQKIERLNRLKQKDVARWQSLVEMLMADYKKQAAVDDMVWRGIAPEVRSKAWWKEHLAKALAKSLDNKQTFDQAFCDHYFGLYDGLVMPNIRLLEDLQLENYRVTTALELYRRNAHASESKLFRTGYQRLVELERAATEKIHRFESIRVTERGVLLGEIKAIYDQLANDLLDTFPDLNFFQGFDVIQKLTRVIISFVLYLYDTQSTGSDRVSDYYFPAFNNLVAVFFYQYRNSYKTFAQICQLYTRRLPQLLLSYQVAQNHVDNASDAAAAELARVALLVVSDSLHDYFLTKYELLMNRNCNRLYTHFKVVGLHPLDYLPELVIGLFSNMYNFELTCHVLDVFLFEEDDVIVKLVLGLFQQISYKLFGSKREILQLLRGGATGSRSVEDSRNLYRYFNVGYEHEFIERVKGIKVC